MIPAFLIKPLLWLVALAVLGFALSAYHTSVYQDGYNEARDLYNRRELDASNAAKDALEAAMLAAANTELKLRTELQAIDQRRNREQNDANLTIERLRADITSGARRLSIPTTRTACSAVPAAAPDSGTRLAAGPIAEERAELDPKTSLDLIAVTDDGNVAIRERNALIDIYNATANRCRQAGSAQ